MLFISTFLGLLATHPAPSQARYVRATTPGALDETILAIPPSITHRDSFCTASGFYNADYPQDMCGPSTITSLTDVHCHIGDASLVDDCNDLIADLKALGGGGFWGMTDKGIMTVASHGTCTFHIKKSGNQFDIGTLDMIDLIFSAIRVSQDCKGKKVTAATGSTSCTYKGTTVDTTWWIEGPNGNCD
ncbi:hypothetical protein VPNG_08261 [Cytospora leucostoma]|uniref:Ecp2 effector protein-like domain-containing protein n=1 Tax=Cytospora leucostoma TaxID=1230097 RepID=A0A423WBY7_9PEZI|nr:hypothetical protein VPNG_08261 [Cytospora leucostoma]